MTCSLHSDDRGEVKERFLQELMNAVDKQEHYTILTKEKYQDLLKEIREAASAARKTTLQYRRIKRFDIIVEDGVEKIIAKRTSDNMLYYLKAEDVFDVVERCHLEFGHCGRDKLRKETCKNFANITITMINLYLSMCCQCQEKKSKKKAQFSVDSQAVENLDLSHPSCIVSGLVDVFEMKNQPDGKERCILLYKNLKTEFIQLRYLSEITSTVVAGELKKLFLIFGAPLILHSRKGSPINRMLLEEVIDKLRNMCLVVRILTGKELDDPCVEDLEKSIQLDLSAWMLEAGDANWCEGLYFVQFAMNSKMSASLNMSPFKATFGVDPIVGVFFFQDVSEDDLCNVNCEQDLLQLIKLKKEHTC